jgi:hypothetical protein
MTPFLAKASMVGVRVSLPYAPKSIKPASSKSTTKMFGRLSCATTGAQSARPNARADNTLSITAAGADRVPCSASRIEVRHILRGSLSNVLGFIKISRWLVN